MAVTNHKCSIFSELSIAEIDEALIRGSAAAKIHNERIRLNETQDEFAKRVGVSHWLIRMIEDLTDELELCSLLEVMDKIGYDMEINFVSKKDKNIKEAGK